ncbi:CCA tRNA nucleotidyltransferase [Ligilactobacillus ceti]|uniref:CCA-adding enzyme n=1 Tax=Ligilactobacillus ceti DSM 22408 TaxID=1122146 RepID=A0A0R2KHE6_9LACO|nr:CCA tRNA nucleotidyltransferase [Ligilactobacillus ceti]KRN88767.1 cca-adding enzyme [Ligilactobacillus ceti DSM 22408]
MKLEQLPTEFEAAAPILERINAAGYEAYFVGGSVRDTILGLPIHDVDIATSAYPAEIKAIFKKTVDTGIEHGTVMVIEHGEGYEITTFRTESTYQDFRRPDHVEFVRSLKEDLKRRDLTINALAMDTSGQIVDLFDGLADLEQQIIRAVGDPNERYYEDALRMMRTVRFASQLDFEIEEKTQQAIQENAYLLEKISVERIHVEWIKLLLGKAVKKGLASFLATDLANYCPGFQDQQTKLQQLLAVEDLHLSNEVAAWSVLVYLFELDQTQTRKFLKSWKVSNEIINQTLQVQKALQALLAGTLDAKICYQTGENLLVIANEIANLWQQGQAETEIKAQYQALPIKNMKELQINGGLLMKELNVKPSAKMGEVLHRLEEEVIYGQIANEQALLLQKAAEYYMN